MISGVRIGRNAKRGQLAFEFLLVYSLFIALFVTALFVTTQRATQQQQFAEQIFARETVVRFSDEINAAVNIPGYEKNYSFPRTTRGGNYSLQISNGLISISYTTVASISFIYPLTTSNVWVEAIDTNVAIGDINTRKGWMLIRNFNGQVVITQ